MIRPRMAALTAPAGEGVKLGGWLEQLDAFVRRRYESRHVRPDHVSTMSSDTCPPCLWAGHAGRG
jgi:hypothetical protein